MNSLYLKQMKELTGNEYEAYLKSLGEKPNRGFRVNTLKTTEEKLFSVIDLQKKKSPFADNGYYFLSDEPVAKMPAYMAGLFYMQEPSASGAVTMLDPKPGMKVLDLCAAPGSKATQIAEKLGNDGFLCVNEINRSRAQVLLENIVRSGASNVMVLNSDTQAVADAFEGYFDAVLCDAPCSGEGMFRKEEEAVRDWSPENVEACARRQSMILENAYRCLKENGVLLYSTCTFNRTENEDVIAGFLSRHDNMKAEKTDVSFGRPGLITPYGTELARRIFPMDEGEGHFMIRLRKTQNDAEKKIRTLTSQRIPKEAEQFMEEMLENPYPYVFAYKDRVYGGSSPFIDAKGCRLIRNQVLIGEMKHNRFEPSHHFFMSSWSPFRKRAELDDDLAMKYFHGEQLAMRYAKGWAAACWKGYPVGGVRSDGSALKNKYPKELRL